MKSPRLRGAAALAVSGVIALGSAVARADDEPASAATVRIAHEGALVEISASELGLDIEAASSGAIAAVRWAPARLTAACTSVGDGLSLRPPFEGDVDIDGDDAAPIYPEPGEAIDCEALGLSLERALASGAPAEIEAPVIPAAPRVSAGAVDDLAAALRSLLREPITLDVTFEGQIAGTITLSPDDIAAALRVTVTGEPPRLEAMLRTSLLTGILAPVLSPLGELAEDARFEINGRGAVKVVPGRAGVRLEGANLLAAAQKAAAAPDKKATVAADKGDPAITTSKAEALQLKGLVSTFTTRHPCCQARVTNIHRIATLLDGAIVEAGERFSVNQRVGKRTAKRGFVLAPSIGEGELVETVGGGVSQMTTTLYNAVFDAGYAVVSRKPHTFYFSRYPMGVEATLSFPRPDFVFRNDSKSGVLIRTSFTEESVTVKLYGDNEGRKVKRFISKQFDMTDPRTDYDPDDTLPLDKPKVKDSGTQGFSVKAGRDIVFADGKKKHEERKVIYHGKPRVVVAHPCAIPKGEKGHRKKGCPKPDEATAEKDAP